MNDLLRTASGLTATSGLKTNKQSKRVRSRTDFRPEDLQTSLGKILLPSTIGIPPRNGNPESRLRDPRLLWAPAITISGRTDQPLITSQYQKKEQRLIEQSERIKLNPKTMTNADLSRLTRIGNDQTKLPISFLPHKIDPSRKPLSISSRKPGPASYQTYNDYEQKGETFLYTRQPRVLIQPLIGPKLKRERREMEKTEKLLPNIRPFWTTIGTRTHNSRLPNAPISTIHHRFDTSLEKDEKTNKSRGFSTPGPAMYSVINEEKCSSRGVTISPKYREKTLIKSGPPMIERAALDKGYKNILRTAPAFSMSSRWSPYSHTYTAECSEEIS